MDFIKIKKYFSKGHHWNKKTSHKQKENTYKAYI